MDDPGGEEFDATAREPRATGRSLGADASELGSMLAHAYRGEIDRVVTWRERLDQTTTWAVTLMAAILTWAFTSPDNPHYIILIGIVVVALFLAIEARRYRYYDVFRSRVRILQENLFATALDPSRGVERHDWRQVLSRDYRRQTVNVTRGEAIAHRLRRVYLPLLGVLLVAWIFRIGAFSPRADWLAAGSIERVPGVVVITSVAGFYALLLGVALWPRERHAKGKFHDEPPEDGGDGK
jgi:uncharacterized membrane protein